MVPRPTTYARARSRRAAVRTLSISARRAAADRRSLRIVSLVTRYPTTLSSAMSAISARRTEAAERSRECCNDGHASS
jgi:hypothetical protein